MAMDKDLTKRLIEEKISALKREQEENLARALAQKFGFPYIDLVKTPLDWDALHLAKIEEVKNGFFIPFQKVKKILFVACLDPENEFLKKKIEEWRKEGYALRLFLCSKTSFQRGLKEYERISLPKEKLVGRVTLSDAAIERITREVLDLDSLKEELQKTESEINLFIESFLGGAVRFEASDIHIIPQEDRAILRYRLDGLMHPIYEIPKKFFTSLLYRLKLLSGLKINVTSIPQDGRFTIKVEKREIEVRVSTVPGEHGEDIVMRILDPKMLLSLEELGLHPFYYQKLSKAMKKPQGMILTTGPTGSGKTTTLYACLKKIATPEVKVITIEDPIEYHLKGIDQTQVDHKKGYTFPVALRAALRQDPDIILVGEIRDVETAQTAIQAALTGHLVFSTLHTNDAAGIVPRLIEMGITSSTIPSALNLGMAQRLLRRLCKKCKKETKIPSSLWEKIEKNIQNIPKEYLPDISRGTFFVPQGCKDCYFTGYRGRIGIYEMFEITPKLEEIINFSPSISQMRKTLKEEGMITMQQDGLLRVLEGETSLEELQKVTGPLE